MEGSAIGDAVLVGLGVSSGDIGLAQESNVSQNSRKASSPTAELPVVVVNARRQEEQLQTVPIAVSALSAEDLRDHNVTSMQDLALLLPSLNINNSSGPASAFVLRGQTQILGAPPGVIAYFSEVPIINSQTPLGLVQGGLSTGEFFDLTSIDVLKGPQGTLFGRNTTGGAILITPQRPIDRLDGFAQLTFGEYDWREFEGAVNAPLADGALLIRLACDLALRDGYTTDVGPFFPGRDYDNRNYQAARLSALWSPSSRFENYLVANIYHRNQHGVGGVLNSVNPGSLATEAFPEITEYLAQQQARGPRHTSLSSDQIDRELSYGFFNTTRWSLTPAVELRNIAAYQVDKNTFGTVDSDYTNFALQDVSIPKTWGGTGQQFSEELQLRGTASGGHLKWTVGGYFEYTRPTDTAEFDVTEPAAVAPGEYVPIVVAAQGATTQHSRAIYGQTVYDLGGLSRSLQNVRLTTGVRYTWDTATESSSIYLPTFGNVCIFTAGTAPACLLSPSGSWSAPTWTLALDDQLTPQLLAYVTTRRGYKSGGFNLTTALHAQDSTFGPEYVTDVEAGIKAEWQLWGMSVRSNVALFHSDYTDIQRTIVTTINNISAPLTVNVAGATINGFELEQLLNATEHSEVSLSYSYLDSRYDHFFSALSGDLTGRPFPYTPRNKVSVSGLYRFPLAVRIGDVSARITYSYQSAVNGQLSGGTYDEIEGYGLLDLRLNWNRMLGSSLGMSFFVTNATDKTYVTKLSSTYTVYGVNGVVYGEPRIIGVQLRYTLGQ